MKRLAATLSSWSKKEFGDIFANVKDFEEKVRNAEAKMISNNSEENRARLHQINAEYIRHLKVEEAILKKNLIALV